MTVTVKALSRVVAAPTCKLCNTPIPFDWTEEGAEVHRCLSCLEKETAEMDVEAAADLAKAEIDLARIKYRRAILGLRRITKRSH